MITTTKDKLNALSEAQIAHKAEVDWFTEHLPKMVSTGLRSTLW